VQEFEPEAHDLIVKGLTRFYEAKI